MEKQTKKDRPFSNMELSAFCNQMALILKSGISALEGITIMLEDSVTQEEKDILNRILEAFQKSGNLCQSLETTGLFSPYMLHMIQIGEETGTLDEVMEALSRHYDREESIRQSIRSAITYPLIMAVMIIVVIVVLLVKVMPVFHQVFVQLGSEMSGFSQILMHVGNIMNRYAIFFILLFAAVFVLALYMTKTASGKTLMQKIGYRIPFTRSLYEAVAACRFASGMALTLSSGLNAERSMELVQSLNEDPFFRKKLDACKDLTEKGTDLSEALHTSGILTGIYSRMASIGQKTGSMEQVMNQIAESYQNDIDSRMSRALSVLEPTLVIGLSLIVGIILLSVMLPLMGIMSGI